MIVPSLVFATTVPATARPVSLALTALVDLAPTIAPATVTVSGRTVCVRWDGLGMIVLSRDALATARLMEGVWMVRATVRLVSWGRPVSRRCVPMDARDMVVAMVSLESASVMLAMVVLTAPSPSAPIARTETVVTRPPASARLAGRATLAATRLVKMTVPPMAASAVRVTACAPLVSLESSVRPRLIFAPMLAATMVFVMSGSRSATATRASQELIAVSCRVRRVAMSPMAAATMVLASVPPITLVLTAVKRSAPTTALDTVIATVNHVLATVTLGGVVTIVP